MTKAKLYKELIKFDITYRDLQKESARVVSENRGLPIEEARWKKNIRPNEVRQIKAFFGVES